MELFIRVSLVLFPLMPNRIRCYYAIRTMIGWILIEITLRFIDFD